MRVLVALLLVVAGVGSVAAQAPQPLPAPPSAPVSPAHAGRGGPHPDVYVDVPLDHDSGVVFPFGGAHHAVPGVVGIDTDPYVCPVHHLTFRERAKFIEHLVTKHGLRPEDIPSRVLVEGSQVRYVGE